MATGSCQGIMKSIATTGIWLWLQLAAVVIGGKNGAEILHTRIRPFSVRPQSPGFPFLEKYSIPDPTHTFFTGYVCP